MGQDASGMTPLDDGYIPIRCPDPLCFSDIFRIYIHPETKRIAYLCAQCHRGSYDDNLKEEGRLRDSGDQGNPLLN